MNIVFIGNCQLLSLCYYFQQLLNTNNNIFYICYGKNFIPFTKCGWASKCKNKIIEYKEAIDKIKNSDFIIYQNISLDKSIFCNTNKLIELKKENCKIIQISSICVNMSDFDNSIKKMITREEKNNTTIKVSEILKRFRYEDVMLTNNHPTTFLFMEIIKVICNIININFFTKESYKKFISDRNYMKLPNYN